MGFGPNSYNGKNFEDMSPSAKRSYNEKVQEVLRSLHGAHKLGDEGDLHAIIQKAAKLGMVYSPDGQQVSPEKADIAGKNRAAVSNLLIVARDPNKSAEEASYYQFELDEVDPNNVIFYSNKPMPWKDVVEKQDAYRDAAILDEFNLEGYVSEFMKDVTGKLSKAETLEDHRDHLMYTSSFGIMTYADGAPFTNQDVKKLMAGEIYAEDIVITIRENPEDVTARSKYGFVLKDGKLHMDMEHPLTEEELEAKRHTFLHRKTPKEMIEAIAASLDGNLEQIPDDDAKSVLSADAQMSILGLEEIAAFETLNGKSFIRLQPENEVYRIGSNEPMTQDEFVKYTMGLKKPEKPSGFLSGLREWFHKNIHPLKDFTKYETQMKRYEIKKYDICKDAGLDVSGKAETIEQYKADLVAETEKNIEDAKKQIQRNCRLADVDQLLDAFGAAVKADPEVGDYLLEALPKQNLSTCKDLQWDMASSKIEKYSDSGRLEFSVSDRDMHIGKDLSLMKACKRFLPPELQEKVDAKYAEAQEPYWKMKETMGNANVTAEEKSKLYKDWQSKEFEKTYWANKNAPKVEEPAEKKLNEMSNEARVAEIMRRRENMDNSVVEETAEKYGVDKEMVQRAIETANAGNDVEVDVEALSGRKIEEMDDQLNTSTNSIG